MNIQTIHEGLTDGNFRIFLFIAETLELWQTVYLFNKNLLYDEENIVV
jgi:hypothetical protein